VGNGKQIAVTVAFGSFAERLDRTFSSFLQNPFLELHAFIIGEKLPEKRVAGVTYHLRPRDHAFTHDLRDAVYRRWLFIDDLDAEYALVVDNQDVLCMQRMPEIPALLRGASFAATPEHMAGRYLLGQGYTSAYINCGVTFWHVPSTRTIRQEIIARGRAQFRNIDDQMSINEVFHTLYYDQMVLLPSQYNYRACIAPTKIWGWPTVTHLDGVVIYHNSHCIEAARKLIPVKARAELPDLTPDPAPLDERQQFWRRVRERLKPHVVTTVPPMGQWLSHVMRRKRRN
jgi:hypothetical protein